MAVVEREVSERIATLRLNRPEAKNAINKEVHLALCKAWEELAHRRQRRRGDRHRHGRCLLRRHGPQALRHRIRRRDPADAGRLGQARPRRADARTPSLPQAGDRGRQRLGAGGRFRAGHGGRHPHRLGSRQVRLVRGPARLPSRRRRHRAAGEFLRRGRRHGDAADGRAYRCRARGTHQPHQQGGAARHS